MEFVSILDLKESPLRGRVRPDFYEDLNLNQIIEWIRMVWGGDVTSYYYYFPADAECQEYRRAILQDIKREGLYQELKTFNETVKLWREAQGKKEKVEMKLQKASWHIQEIGYYCDAFEQLYRVLEARNLQAQGLLALRAYLKEYIASEGFLALQEKVNYLRTEIAKIRFTLHYVNDRVIVRQEECEGTYDAFLSQCFSEHNSCLRNPFGLELDLTALEIELLKIYEKNSPDLFKEMGRFYKKNQRYAEKKFVRFVSEIGFYLSFLCFEQMMEAKGHVFATPTTIEDRELSAQGLYDLALACVNFGKDKAVISNDMEYREAERFFVVTGPNQGGKTTFARSLGQLIYFGKMGLDVPAVSANLHYFEDILTHFSVEESVETGRGKLKEELRRLAPMMAEECGNCFIIINELFTTAANYDACIMGKRVLEHFIGLGCRGIYVTHLKELSEAHPQVVSMRAMLDEQRIQSFKIVRSAADDAACAINQVNKYRLTYEQLKERLS